MLDFINLKLKMPLYDLKNKDIKIIINCYKKLQIVILNKTITA